MPVGTETRVTVDRSGKKMDFKLKVGDRDQVFARLTRNRNNPESEVKEEGPSSQAKFGVSLRPLNESELEELPADSRHGMMVTKVEQDSFADEIGMQERDVIVSINRIAVNSMDDIRKIQATLKPGSSVAFKVLRAEGISTRGQRVPRRSFFLSGTLPNQ